MKVFISWSGEKSKAVATALNGWIPEVLQYVTPFMSDAAIDAGTRPLDEIERELGASKFGIICVTSDNYMAPWLNFEAGAISKKLALEPTRVAPLLVDLDANDVNTPLKQFQMKKLDKDGVYDVIRSINKKALEDDEGLDEPRLTSALDRCWPDLLVKIEAAKTISPSLDVKRTPGEKMDDVLESVRLLTDEVRNLRRTTGQRTAPGTFEWSRVPAGLSGDGTMRAVSTLSVGASANAEVIRYRSKEFRMDVDKRLEGTPFKLLGITKEGEDSPPTLVLVRTDPDVPDKITERTRARLLSMFPGVDIEILTEVPE